MKALERLSRVFGGRRPKRRVGAPHCALDRMDRETEMWALAVLSALCCACSAVLNLPDVLTGLFGWFVAFAAVLAFAARR